MTNSTVHDIADRPVAPAETPVALSHRQILTILSGLLLGIFLAALDQNIVSVAIVRIANSLHGFDQQAWATTGYLVTATISTPLYGKLADIYGRKPLFLAAIALFVVGSAACTVVTSMYELAGCRAFQGLGAGGLMSLALTIVGDIVPARERVRYQGYFTVVFGSATVIGPVLGGFLSDYATLWGLAGWRWIFLVNVPVGLLAWVVVGRVLNVPHQRQHHGVDWLGAVTLAIAVVPILLVAEQGRSWGWESQRSVACFGIGAVGAVVFVGVELFMKDAALLPMRLFAHPTFVVTMIGGFIVGVAMFGGISMVPLYLQVVRGFSPTKAGLLMLPLVAGITVGSQLSGRITQATGRYKILPVLGTVVMALAAVLFAQTQVDSPLWQPLLCSGLMGFGLGGCMQTLIIAAQNAGPRSDLGVSTAAATFFRQMGGTVGVAVFLAILFGLLPGRIAAAFGGRLPPGFAAQLGRSLSNTGEIATLPQQVRGRFLVGFTDSLHGVWYVAAAVALVASVVLVFMREVPLREAASAPEPEPTLPQEWDSAPPRAHAYGSGSLAGAEADPPPGRESAPPEGFLSGGIPAVVAEDWYPIVGLVHREDGHPVSGAAVTLIDSRGAQAARAVAGADGGYHLDAPAVGSYVLIVSAAGHRPAAVSVQVGQWPQSLNVTLPGAGELAGVVRSAVRGEPVPGATVTLTDAQGEVVGTAITDADGTYRCTGIAAGTYTLVAVANRMRPAATTLTVPEHGLLSHGVELLSSLAVLAGCASAYGRGVPDAQLVVLDSGGQQVALARTDEQGCYVVADLPEGQYTVVARGYPPVSNQVTVAGSAVTYDVRLGYEHARP